MELYPLRFESIYVTRVWGGRRLEQLGRRLPPDVPIGESWDVDDASRVSNGPLAGHTLAELVPQLQATLVGRRVWDREGGWFPLLLKLIDATQALSVQVHPDDDYAHAQGEPRGKTECWYVLDAAPGSELIHGMKVPADRAMLEQAIRENRLDEYLQHVPMVRGATIFVPAGTVHALCAGLVYEIQQRSDTTYRLYDWGRMGLDGKPRALHIAPSLDVLDYTLWPKHTAVPVPIPGELDRFYLAASRSFALELWIMPATTRWEVDPESFNLLTVVEGALTVRYGEYGEEQITLAYGETALIPAELGFTVLDPSPQCKVLRAYVPDLWMDVICPLLDADTGRNDILQLGGYGSNNDLAPLMVGRRSRFC